MKFFLKLAWKNVFRNKRRTVIASIAIGIGLASLIVTDGIMIGMKKNLIDSATSTLLGEAQIHNRDFRLTQDVEKTIEDPDIITKDLKKELAVRNFSHRVISFGMVTSPSNVESIILYGIVPNEERFLSKVDDNILEGDYFSDNNVRDIVIGEKLAKVLEVTIGDRIVITVAQACSGDLGQDMFRVSGIYRFGIKEMDNGMAFIRLNKAQQMLNLKNKIHEIAINFTDLNFAGNKNADFWQKYSKGQNEAVSWVKILPELKNMLEMSNLSMAIMGMILFVVVVFGIINTLFMSLYERMFEFGILRAVGTRPSGIRKLIIFESAVLAFISIIIGVILGFIIMMILVKWGIDYRGIEMAGAVISDMLYPVVELRQFIIYPFFVFIFTVLIGLYPAFVAGKIVITDALRKSL